MTTAKLLTRHNQRVTELENDVRILTQALAEEKAKGDRNTVVVDQLSRRAKQMSLHVKRISGIVTEQGNMGEYLLRDKLYTGKRIHNLERKHLQEDK